jgi:hypothetical protein
MTHDADGYVLIHKPDHKRANSLGYVRQSILAWEDANDRSFPEGMEPHHKDLDKSNDDPNNIEPKTHSKHIKDHKVNVIMKRRDIFGRFAEGEEYAL